MPFFSQFDFVFVLVDFKHCASCGFAFVNFLNPDRAECVRRCFFQCARTCIPGCQHFPAAERSGQGLDDNIVRYANSPVTHDAVPAQHDPLLFHGEVPFALPAPTEIIRFFRLRNLTFKIGVVGIGNIVRCGTLHVERCSRAEHHHCWRQTPPLHRSVANRSVRHPNWLVDGKTSFSPVAVQGTTPLRQCKSVPKCLVATLVSLVTASKGPLLLSSAMCDHCGTKLRDVRWFELCAGRGDLHFPGWPMDHLTGSGIMVLGSSRAPWRQ